MERKMKTRYKASVIIATSAIIYILFHGTITNSCMAITDNGEICRMFWLSDTGIHITTSNWDTGDGTGAWSSGTGDLYQPTTYDSIRDNSGFIFWHMILPTFAILMIYQRDRGRK